MVIRRRGGASAAYDEVATLVDLLRRGEATTRSELVLASRLGRNVVSAQLRQATELGVVEAAGSAPSSGGRAPDRWRFRGEQGYVLVACLGAAAMSLGVADLAGKVLERRHIEWLISQGPEDTLDLIDAQFRSLLEGRDRSGLWGLGIAVPGPVEHETGRPIEPPIMPGWDGFDIRGWFAPRYRVGVWVDNDVNAMALGHVAMNGGPADLIYVKIGTGIGAGLISHGQLHRGSKGCAGDIGHVRVGDRTDVACRCGRLGCLEAYAAGWALERDAITAQVEGRSSYLTSILRERGRITPADIGRGARLAEPTCVELHTRAAGYIGSVLAVLVNFYNPSELVLGGGVVEAGPSVLTAIERVVRERSIGLATDGLVVTPGQPDQIEGLVGMADMVISDLLQPEFLAVWADRGSPNDVAGIVERATQDRVGA